MKRLWRLFLLSVLATTMSSVMRVHAQSRITTLELGIRDVQFMRTDGAYVAWVEPVDPNRYQRYANLTVAALADGKRVLELRTMPFDQYRGPLAPGLAMDQGSMIWVDGGGDTGRSQELRSIHLASGAQQTITTARAAFPALSGDLASWWEDLGWGGGVGAQRATLKLRNIKTMSAPIVVTQIEPIQDYLLRSPRMSANWVVWRQGHVASDNSTVCWDLYAVSTGGGTPRLIDRLDCTVGIVRDVDLKGDVLVYTNQENTLVTLNLFSGERSISGPHGNLDLSTDGRFVFWVKSREQAIWGYDPRTDSAFKIGDASNLVQPALGGGVLTWLTRTAEGAARIHATRISDALPISPRAASDVSGRTYFPETGHSLGGIFGDYWQQNGGLYVFGYPVTEEFLQTNADTRSAHDVQYFERQRFEYHAENRGTAYEVLLGRLGAEALALQGRDWQDFPKADPATPHYFAQTGQAIAPEFWEYWRSHGLEFGDPGISEREALALWGYPLSPAQAEPGTSSAALVQWFERGRFEYHPQNPDPYNVLLGRLAVDRVDTFGWR